MWVGSCFGFVCDEVLTDMAQWRSMLFLGLDGLLVVLACCTVRNRLHMLGMALLLALSWFATCVAAGESMMFWGNGVRDFLGVMLAYPVLCYFMAEPGRRERFLDTLDRHLLVWLMVQAFCVTYQFLRYGAGDHCGGSFGNWYSGQVSMCIYAASFFLVHRHVDTNNLINSLKDNKLPVILLFPSFLNETKISFVLIVLYFVLLMPLDRRYLVRAMWLAPVALLLGWVAVLVYTSIVKDSDDIFSMDYVTEYIMIDDVDEAEGGALWDIAEGNAADVPRLTKLMYLPLLHEQEPGHELTGWGVGQFKGGQGMQVSEFADRYDWLLSGSIPYAFHVHIQMGQVGLVFMAAWLLLLFVIKPSWARDRDLNMQLLALFMVIIILLYNDSLRDQWMCSFLFLLLASSWTVDGSMPEGSGQDDAATSLTTQ